MIPKQFTHELPDKRLKKPFKIKKEPFGQVGRERKEGKDYISTFVYVSEQWSKYKFFFTSNNPIPKPNLVFGHGNRVMIQTSSTSVTKLV